MKRYITAAVLVGLVAILALATVVSAQDQTPPAPEPGKGWGRGAMQAYAEQMHPYMQQAMAEALGLTVEELQARHDAGEKFFDIVEEQGLTVEEARTLKLDARNAAVDQMVEDGVLTAEQAELMKERGGRMMGGRGSRGGGCMGGDGASQFRHGPGMRGNWSQQDG